MSKAKITKRTVDAINVHEGKPGSVRLWDTEIRGFGVRAYPSGRKVYVFKFSLEGRQGFETIGDHGDPHTPDSARDRALELSYAISRGEDPGARRKAAKPSLTVGELIDKYLLEGPASRPNKRATTWVTETSRLNRHVRPLLGRKAANKVTSEDVADMQSDIAAGKTALVERSRKPRGKAIVEGGRSAAANAIVCLSAMYSWAIWKKLVTANPCRGVEKFARTKRVRFFSADEVKALLDALETLEAAQGIQQTHAEAIRLLMLTGARKMEILGLRWNEVHLERRLIMLPSARSKNDDLRTIYLPKPAIEILERQSRQSVYVFANERSAAGHVTDISWAWRKVRSAAGVTNARLHDLRHNLASTAVGMNISLRLTGALLGHKSQQSTEIYAHVASDPAHEASELVAAKLWKSREAATAQ